jgi:hypothetical protein
MNVIPKTISLLITTLFGVLITLFINNLMDKHKKENLKEYVYCINNIIDNIENVMIYNKTNKGQYNKCYNKFNNRFLQKIQNYNKSSYLNCYKLDYKIIKL